MEGSVFEAVDMGIPCNTGKNRANSVQTPPDMENPCKTMQFTQKHGITMLLTFSGHKLYGNAMWEQTQHFFLCNVASEVAFTWKNHVSGNP